MCWFSGMASSPTRRVSCRSRSRSLVCKRPVALLGLSETNTIGYYQQQRDKGAVHQVAVRTLAFTWIRIVFRCWQNRTPYDESVYLAALQRRGSSLLSNLAKSSKKGEKEAKKP